MGAHPRAGRRVWRARCTLALAGISLVLAAQVAAQEAASGPPQPVPEPAARTRIAVLPFRVYSAREPASLGEDLAGELRGRLEAFGSLRVGLRMRRVATVLSGSACCVYGLSFVSHFYGARRSVGYVPFNSETLVTGKLFEDIRDAVHELADPDRYDAVVVTNLCVPTASGVPLRLLPNEINGVRIIGIDVPGFGVPTHAEAKDVLAGAMLVTSFALLYQERIAAVLKTFAAQSITLALAVAWAAWSQDRPDLFITALIAFTLKGIIIPVALHRTVARLGIHREVEKVVGVGVALIVGLALTALAQALLLKVAQP